MGSTKSDKLVEVQKKYKLDLEALIETVKSYNSNFNEHKFREAFEFAAKAHEGQFRKQENIPYIVHPLETVKILTQIHADEPTLIAAFLHDVPEDTAYTLEQIESKFGKQVAYMVEGITKLSKVHYRHDMQQREIESMKKLFIHAAEDPRTMLIKLADRLHNMRTLEYMDVPEKRLRKARETLEIFTPIANLLGIKELQSELEDLCFLNLYPEDYLKIKENINQAKKAQAENIENMIAHTEKELKAHQIDSIVYLCQENFYQIYNRLQKEGKTLDEMEVVFPINVILHEKATCYETLGVVHGLYKPQPGKFKDYISLPKANGYQSIHTTVFGDNGISVKFRIRTNQMHFEAQYGIASSYFNPDSKKRKIYIGEDPRSQWVEEVIAIQKEQNVESKYFDELKTYVFQDRITVLTPKGRIVDLPTNATCIDFAYSIHTEVGNRAIRAIVNGDNFSLDHQLKKGDVVKIITTDYPKGPSYEWLSFAKTPLARKRMKEFFKHDSLASKVNVGRRMLQKEYDRAGMGLVTNLARWRVNKIAQQFPTLNIQTTDDILVHLAEGTISTLEVINLFEPQLTAISEFSRDTGKITAHQKLTKLSVRVVCATSVNFAELAGVLQKRKDCTFLISGDTRYNYLHDKVIYRATMLVRGYNDISTICRDLENIPGVEEVQRLFWSKKIVFFLGSVFTFAVWAFHPLILFFLTNSLGKNAEEMRVVANIVLFCSLVTLFSLISFLKYYTEKSFPELRETNRLWQVAYILSFFALLTIFLEIYLYKLNFDWPWVMASAIMILGYLTGQYIYYKDRNAPH